MQGPVQEPALVNRGDGSAEPIVPIQVYCEIAGALGDAGEWVGELESHRLTLTRIEQPVPGVRYIVMIGRTWVSGLRPDLCEALKHVGFAIQHAREYREAKRRQSVLQFPSPSPNDGDDATPKVRVMGPHP